MKRSWQEWAKRLCDFYIEVLAASTASSRHLTRVTDARACPFVAALTPLEVDAARFLNQAAVRLNVSEATPTAVEAEIAEIPADLEDEAALEGLEDAGPDAPSQTEAAVSGDGRDRNALIARRIERKQRTDPHNRETVVGFPTIAVRAGQELIAGPLLYWEVDLDYDPSRKQLTLRKRTDNPNVNTLLLSKLADEEGETHLATDKLLPIALAEDFGEQHIARMLFALEGTFELLGGGMHPHTVQGDPVESLRRGAKALKAGDGFLVWSGPLLINGPRSNAFLLDDLKKISSMSIEGDSVLAQVVDDVPPERLEPKEPIPLPFLETKGGEEPLWFPFPSNEAQRRVAQAAKRARILTVQGPPGTGKSQTIANLVCQLVSEGKTVLVSSHQRKALEVLQAKLRAFPEVALAVLRDDKEAMARLRGQVEAALTQDLFESESGEAIANGLDRLHGLDRDLRALAHRYMELREIEHSQFSRFVTYASLRDFDVLDPRDGVPAESAHAIARDLQEWAEGTQRIVEFQRDLDDLYRSGPAQGLRTTQRRIHEVLGYLVDQADFVHGGISGDAVAVARALDGGDGGADYAACLSWLSESGRAMQAHPVALSLDELAIEAVARCADAWMKDDLSRIADDLERLRQYFDRTPTPVEVFERPPEPLDRGAIRRHTALLRTKGRRWLWWNFSPEVRRSRRELGTWGVTPRRSVLLDDLAPVEAACDTLDRGEELGGLLGEMERHLAPLGWRSPVPNRSRLTHRDFFSAAVQARAVLEFVQLGRNCPVEPLRRAGAALNCPPTLKGLASESLERALVEARRWRLGQIHLPAVTELPLGPLWRARTLRLRDSALSGHLDEEAVETARALDELQGQFRLYERLIDLETGSLRELSHSIEGARAAISATGERPSWITHAEQAVEAHRLSSLLRQSLGAAPDSVEEVAAQLRQGQERRLLMIQELVRRKRRKARAEGVQSPRTTLPLKSLLKLLQRKKMTQSFLSLRNHIDFQAVFKVFPCWITTTEDAARIFPPTPGMFDVLILDEASQCSQTSLLPLALRARQMVIVGDEKQLKPAGSRFVSASTLELLQRRFDLDRHPKGPFLDGKDSLLAVADACSEARAFLNEHFRCDPAIIEWSNQRFYSGRLKVLTGSRADRAALPLEIRTLAGADDDPEGQKNRAEAEAVVEEVRRLVSSGEAMNRTIGVISPYRGQADLIQLLLERAFEDRPAALKEHEIVASTADGFQGDERDIIIYSFRYGPSSKAGTVLAIQREEERLNVAFTRARLRAVCVTSVPVSRFPSGAIQDFLDHARRVELDRRGAEDGTRPDRFDSDFERQVCEALRARGLSVRTQEPCGPFLIDLVIVDAEGRTLAVECDGEWKMDALGELRREDYQRQDLIERAGWVVHRIPGRRWHLDPERELDRVERVLAGLPTRVEEALVVGGGAPSHATAGDDEAQEPDDEAATATSSVVTAGETQEPDTAEDEDEDWHYAALEPLGSSHDAVAASLHTLVRWLILGRTKADWRLEEEVHQLREAVQGREPLEPSEVARILELWAWAGRRGFEPSLVPPLGEF